jgi:hypothetical protein
MLLRGEARGVKASAAAQGEARAAALASDMESYGAVTTLIVTSLR